MDDGIGFDMKDGVTKILCLLARVGISLIKENKMLLGDGGLSLYDACEYRQFDGGGDEDFDGKFVGHSEIDLNLGLFKVCLMRVG